MALIRLYRDFINAHRNKLNSFVGVPISADLVIIAEILSRNQIVIFNVVYF